MKKNLLLIQERFGLTDQQVIDLEKKGGKVGIFVMPVYDNSEPENEIHLKHQLLVHMDEPSERIISEVTEVNTFMFQKGKFKITGMRFQK